MVYELEVHQIELEIQNEELRKTQSDIETVSRRYVDLFDFAPVGYLTLSELDIILKANFKAAKMLGLVRSHLVNRRLAEFIFPADQDMVSLHRQTLFASGTPQAYELRMMKNDGSVFWVDMEANLVQDVGRSVLDYQITLNDITERKQVEQALRETEQHYRSLLDNMADGVYRSTPQGKFVSVNQAMVKMFGYASQEEMLALDIKKELYFSSEERANIILQTNQQQGAIESFRMRRKDGSEIWVEDNAQYVFDGQGKVLFHEGILRDITERKQAEEDLRQSEKRFRLLVDNAPLAISVIDLETTEVLYVNPLMAVLFEMPLEELLG
ncbi:MAG: PAS domain S-box protein, partial [Chloroflexota bacterium]